MTDPISAAIVYELLQDVDRRNETRHQSLRTSLDQLSNQLLQATTARLEVCSNHNARLVKIETQLTERSDVTRAQIAIAIPVGTGVAVVVWETIKHFVGWS